MNDIRRTQNTRLTLLTEKSGPVDTEPNFWRKTVKNMLSIVGALLC